jgi:hypothetical protein
MKMTMKMTMKIIIGCRFVKIILSHFNIAEETNSSDVNGGAATSENLISSSLAKLPLLLKPRINERNQRRRANVYVTLEHEGLAYIDEIYPVVVCVGNEEGEGVRVFWMLRFGVRGLKGRFVVLCGNFGFVYSGVWGFEEG